MRSYQVKNTKQERQWSTAAGVSFPGLHASKLINQSLHVVDLNIDRYDVIIGRYLISYFDIYIHGADMTIHWDISSIPWRDIYSTTNDAFSLLQ